MMDGLQTRVVSGGNPLPMVSRNGFINTCFFIFSSKANNIHPHSVFRAERMPQIWAARVGGVVGPGMTRN